MSESVLFYGALAAAAASFGLFAWLVVSALNDDASAYAKQMGVETSRAFEDVFMFVSPAKISQIGLYGACAAFFVFFIPLLDFSNLVSTLVGAGLGLAAAAFTFTLPKRYVALLRARRRVKFEEQLVDALGTMSNALRAGFSVNQAFDSVAQTGLKPIAQEFNVLLQQMRVGMNFDDALASLDRRVNSPDLTLVCTSIDVARRTGGNLTEIFDRISETIRGRLRIELRVRTLTAQGRLQGAVVSLMPFVLGVALAVMKPALMIPFLTSAVGAACVAVAVVLVVAGWLVIRKIISIDV